MAVALLNGRGLGTITARGQLSQWLDDLKFQEGEVAVIPASTHLDDPKAARQAWLVGTGSYKQTHNPMGIFYLDGDSVALIPTAAVTIFQANYQAQAAALAARPPLPAGLAATA